MKKLTILSAAITLAVASHGVAAKVTPAEAAKLGKELTPIGAETKGNADGSIPAWTGGIDKPIAGYKPGDHHPDPFSTDKVLYTITAKNVDKYKEILSPGQLALFKTYPDSFKMNVYPTRRSAAYPQFVYDAIKANATRSELIEGGNGLSNAAIGVPFPLPTTGLEVIWNHMTRYRGVDVSRRATQVSPTASGDFTPVEMKEELRFKYNSPDTKPEDLQATNTLFLFKQVIKQPARLAGTSLLVHETMNQEAEARKAWTYNTGQRRVRRAPNVAFDTPGTASDGLRTTDDFDMYNGSPSRYNWKLLGKKEMLIPYNSYKLHAKDVDYDDLIKPGHINQDYVRYEKHRVWVVEAELKEGMRHTYKKRVFFIDEDSWQASVADIYDNRDELYRVAMAHGLNYYEVPTPWSTLEVFHDLQARRYLALGLDNDKPMYKFDAKLTDKQFTPQALRREGRR